jgi:hypothetical protein
MKILISAELEVEDNDTSDEQIEEILYDYLEELISSGDNVMDSFQIYIKKE